MTRDSVKSTVFRHLHELSPATAGKELDTRAPLNEIGVDSLDLVDVASRSMQELGVKIPRSEVGKIRCMDDLVDVLFRLVDTGSAS